MIFAVEKDRFARFHLHHVWEKSSWNRPACSFFAASWV